MWATVFERVPVQRERAHNGLYQVLGGGVEERSATPQPWSTAFSARSRAYNRPLSDQRIAAIRTHSDCPGVSALRLDSQGYGKNKPIVDESTEEA